MAKSDANIPNSDEHSVDSSGGGGAAGPSKLRVDDDVPGKRRSLVTIIGRTLLVCLVALLLMEVHARHYYGKSLEAIRHAVQAHRERNPDDEDGLPLTAVEPLITGLPRRLNQYHVSKPVHLVTYFSFFRTYAIRLELTSDRNIDTLQTGEWEKGRYSDDPVTISQHLTAKGYDVPRQPGYAPDRGAVVQLKFGRKTRRHRYRRGAVANHLCRELFRQAFLIAARDELQLRTRDVNFGEELWKIERPPEDTEPLELLVESRSESGGFSLLLYRGTADLVEDLEELDVELDEDASVEAVVSAAERLSRTTFVEWLKTRRFTGRANDVVDFGDIPEEAESSSEFLTTVSQLAAIRSVHESMRDAGESPERLTALSGAYAIFGELTDHLLHPMPAAARARALLYAERLVQRSPDSIMGRAGRARVRALVGLHAAALSDIDHLRIIQTDKENPKPDLSVGVTNWLSTIETAARGDIAALEQQTAQEGVSVSAPLAALLQLQHASATGNRQVIISAAQRMLALEPSQGLAFDRLITTAAVGKERKRLSSILISTSQAMAQHSGRLAGLPDSLQKAMEKVPDSIEECALWRDFLDEEFRTFDEQVADGAVDDPSEPALRTVSALLRETGFLQAVRSIEFRDMSATGMGPDVEFLQDGFDRLRPFVRGHAAEEWFLSYSFDMEESWAALRKGWTPQATHDYWCRNSLPLLRRWAVWKLPPLRIARLQNQMVDGGAAVFGDLAWIVRHGLTGEQRRLAARRLLKVSPHSEVAVGAAVSGDWGFFEDQAVGWEEQFAKSAHVQAKLGEAWLKSMRFVEAERCLKRSFALSADHYVMKLLAQCALDQGEEELWLAEMDRAAELELSSCLTPIRGNDWGLELIAPGLLRQGKPERALEYAERAANAGAARGPSVAAACYEAMGDFANAEKQIRIRREQYQILMDWYCWCHRTGYGDVRSAAATIPQEKLEELRTNPRSDACLLSMLHSQLNGDVKAAIKRLLLAHNTSLGSGPESHLYLELLTLEYGKPVGDPWEFLNDIAPEDNPNHRDVSPEKRRAEGLRLVLLSQASFIEKKQPTAPRQFFVELRRHLLSNERTPLNLQRLWWIVRAYGTAGFRTDMHYLIGRILLLDGRKDEALPYLELAATSPYSDRRNAVLAGFQLRKLGQPASPLRPTELKVDEAVLIRLYDEARAFGKDGEWQRAITRCERIVELAPDWAPAHFYLGQLWQDRGNDELAMQHFDEAVRIEPEIPDLRCTRGRLLQRQGKYSRAAVDYEKAVELDSRDYNAHWLLGMIRAAAPVDELRDSQAAFRHAEALDLDETGYDYNPNVLLAAAHAERGNFEAAIEFAGKPTYMGYLDRDASQRSIANYRAHKPHRLKVPAEKSGEN
jgi:tetratricopeptide (TPR) repeat protein